MDSTQHILEEKVVIKGVNDQGSQEQDSFEQTVTDKAFNGLLYSQQYKQPRMDQIAKFERLYNNDISPKARQLFNIPVPVFPGLVDTLLADFNDDISLKFNATNPAQYLELPKIQALWNKEKVSLAPNAMWALKARWDRFNYILSGKSIMQIFAESSPYRSVLEVINYTDFHCDPLGGGHLENHLFCGKEGIYQTVEDMYTDERYDKDQRDKLKNYQFSTEFMDDINTTYGTKLARFKSMGLDPVSNGFSGDTRLNLCEFIVTHQGARYLVTFEPYTRTWLRVKPWKDIRPSGLYPFVTGSSHEDHKVFWNKSYADDFFYTSEVTIILVNQELTNREKKNYNARAYDVDMFPDVAKLDEAQYNPDTLVPVTGSNVKGIAAGIYEFQTPELQGTINLVDWISAFTGKQVGITDLQQGSVKPSAKATVTMAAKQELSKRGQLRTDGMEEVWCQLGIRYIEDLKEYMPAKLSVQLIGENGFIEESELKRINVRRMGDLDISVVSSAKQAQDDNIKKQARMNAITMVQSNPNLTKYEKEMIYRDVGNFDDDEISFLMDEQSYDTKRQIAKASYAIQEMLKGHKPEIYYNAEVSYLQYIENYLIEHKDHILNKEALFEEHLKEMVSVVAYNMQRKAKQIGFQQQMKTIMAGPQQGGSVKPEVKPAIPNNMGEGANTNINNNIG